jgi:hypothetical protein
MRPACHAYETREKSAHSERALEAIAPESTRNMISLYFEGDHISDLAVTEHPLILNMSSRLPSLALELASVRIDAIANVFSHRKLRISYTIPYPTLYSAR